MRNIIARAGVAAAGASFAPPSNWSESTADLAIELAEDGFELSRCINGLGAGFLIAFIASFSTWGE